MIKFIKSLFGKKEVPAAEVPYKVETPAEPSPVAVQASEAVVTSIKPAKKPAAKKAPAKATAKKTSGRKPKQPKA